MTNGSSLKNVTQKTVADLLPEKYLTEEVAAIPVLGVALDSRKVKNGSLFIALQGELCDGREFIDQAIAAGASCVFREAQSPGLSFDKDNGVPIVDVANLPFRVSAIAGEFYDWPAKKLTVIAVTGTNGKTSSVVLLCDLLHKLGKKTAVIGTLGYGVWGEPLNDTGHTTPDPIACQRMLAELHEKNVEFVAMEASSHAIGQGRLESINFKGLVFTNLSRDHLDYHATLENYENAKLRLFQFPEVEFVVSNSDSETGEKALNIAKERGVKAYAFGMSKSADIRAESSVFNLQGIKAVVKTPWGQRELTSSLLGEFNLYNLLAVVAVALHLGCDFDAVIRQLQNLNSVQGRMQRIKVNDEQNIEVLLDYAHSPDALEKSLLAIPGDYIQKLWLVFGCGGDRDRGKRAMMGEIAAKLADKVVLTSDNPRSEDPEKILNDIYSGIGEADKDKVKRIVERESAISLAISEAKAGDAVLVAGKGHENYQIIGTEKSFFDDAEVAVRCLQKRFPSGSAFA